jgi:hypothetical protein
MITNDPADAVMAESLLRESRAAITASHSMTARNIGIAAGVVILGCGLAAAAIIWANGARNDPALFQRAVENAFAHMGPVQVKGEVTLADGATVALKDGGEVTAKVEQPSLPQVSAQPALTAAGDAIKRGITVFSDVSADGDNDVVTGWSFADGKTGQKPFEQYCYYRTHPDGVKTLNTPIADDGVPREAARSQVPDFDSLVSKCVWWKEGAA